MAGCACCDVVEERGQGSKATGGDWAGTTLQLLCMFAVGAHAAQGCCAADDLDAGETNVEDPTI